MESINLNINLTVKQLLEAVKQLSPSDKLKINDAIWESDTDIPQSHQKLVLERIEKSKADPARLLDWDEVSKTL
jgi:hypothetical protein